LTCCFVFNNVDELSYVADVTKIALRFTVFQIQLKEELPLWVNFTLLSYRLKRINSVKIASAAKKGQQEQCCHATLFSEGIIFFVKHNIFRISKFFPLKYATHVKSDKNSHKGRCYICL